MFKLKFFNISTLSKRVKRNRNRNYFDRLSESITDSLSDLENVTVSLTSTYYINHEGFHEKKNNAWEYYFRIEIRGKDQRIKSYNFSDSYHHGLRSLLKKIRVIKENKHYAQGYNAFLEKCKKKNIEITNYKNEQ